jgi:phosphoserine aminotransferase
MFESIAFPSELIPSDPRFGSGPSLIPVSSVKSLLETDKHLLGTSHRKPAIKNLVKEVQEGLRSYFQLPDDYSVVVGNGGATFLFDSIALGLVEKKSVHYTCGEFSSKWFKAHSRVPWVEAENIEVPFGEGMNAKGSAEHPDADMICCTLNETSTGVIVTQMPEVNDQTILAVDATSGGGQVPCDLSKVDLFFFGPQKVFASEGGLYIAIMSPKARARALAIAADKSRYVPDIMNWKTAIDNSDKNQTYNTPSISTFYFLNEQIKTMNKVGYQGVQKETQRCADFIYEWAESKPYLKPYVNQKEFRSNAVATIDVDDKYSADELIKRFEKEQWVYGIDAYRKLGRNQFRIALFYNISFDNLKKLTGLISHAIENA